MSTELQQRESAPASAADTPALLPPQAAGLVLATLEALLGRRGLHQLRPWMGHSAFLSLVELVDGGTFGHSHLGRLRMQMPSPDAIEATARISVGQRWLACTVRLDRAGQWRCSQFAVLGV